MFSPLSFPKADLKLSKKGEHISVWCIIRKKQLKLTPEEWVRQHVIHYLINEKFYPIGLIASEFSIEINGLVRRCDIVVFDKEKTPILIVECKATDEEINEKVLHQIAQYNFKLNTSFLFLTNGVMKVTCKINRSEQTLSYLKELPNFKDLK
ncbi:type I restriction enzyme HsdR N-terminal domain-containing protein [Crocinitomicaceae bacterium]|jgi:type I site-specific restriction endonuclease|nr:type I restriction enzyme HsdR N-terminal domain-containing protein [Crocinitomicaceae bacterium]